MRLFWYNVHMKKTITFFAIIASLAVIIPFISTKTAFADEVTAQSGSASVTVDATPVASPASATADVSSDKQAIAEDAPVILPTNPFYFAKEFARGVRMFFTFGKINKAKYELQITDEKAQELKQVENLAPQNTKGIERAISNYSDNVASLKTRLEALKDTSQNPNVDSLLNDLNSRAASHDAIFEELKNKNTEIKTAAESAQTQINDAATEASIKLDTPEKMKSRLENVLQDQTGATPASQVRVTNMINRIEQKAGSGQSEEIKTNLESVRLDVLKSAQTQMEALPLKSRSSDGGIKNETENGSSSVAPLEPAAISPRE